MNEQPEIVEQEEDEEEADEEKSKSFSSSGANFVFGFLVAMIPVFFKYVLDDDRKEQALDMLSFEAILAVVLLALLVISLLVMSIRQRRRERVYLRAWQERRERRIAEANRRERQRQRSLAHRFGQDSRRRDREATTPDSDEAAFEARMLRSLGMDRADRAP